MAEKTTCPNKAFKEWIPDEAREHARAAKKEMRESIKSLLPPDFVKHRRKARKEMLMAWRSMIDAALEETEK